VKPIGRRVAAALSVVLASAVCAVMPAQTAAADPGSCGVRVFGPDPNPNTSPGGVDGFFTYGVRNRCGQAWDFQVAFYNTNPTPCQRVGPGALYVWTWMWGSNDWYVKVC
jgi:hypothetical protein